LLAFWAKKLIVESRSTAVPLCANADAPSLLYWNKKINTYKEKSNKKGR
jgi:hypothetical protein